jgi:hypothetical protein
VFGDDVNLKRISEEFPKRLGWGNLYKKRSRDSTDGLIGITMVRDKNKVLAQLLRTDEVFCVLLMVLLLWAIQFFLFCPSSSIRSLL